MTIDGPTVVVVGTGYEGKRRYYERLAGLGARLVFVDEPGHWSESLAHEIAGLELGRHTNQRRPRCQCRSDPRRLGASAVRADGVLTSSRSTYARRSAWPRRWCCRVIPLRRSTRRVARSARGSCRAAGAAVAEGPSASSPWTSCLLLPPTSGSPPSSSRSSAPVRRDASGLTLRVAAGRVQARPPRRHPRAQGNLPRSQRSPPGAVPRWRGVRRRPDLAGPRARILQRVPNLPTAQPSFQETGLHLPPDHDNRAVPGLVDLSVQTVQSFGLLCGVLHVEGKCTSRGRA